MCNTFALLLAPFEAQRPNSVKTISIPLVCQGILVLIDRPSIGLLDKGIMEVFTAHHML